MSQQCRCRFCHSTKLLTISPYSLSLFLRLEGGFGYTVQPDRKVHECKVNFCLVPIGIRYKGYLIKADVYLNFGVKLPQTERGNSRGNATKKARFSPGLYLWHFKITFTLSAFLGSADVIHGSPQWHEYSTVLESKSHALKGLVNSTSEVAVVPSLPCT